MTSPKQTPMKDIRCIKPIFLNINFTKLQNIQVADTTVKPKIRTVKTVTINIKYCKCSKK